MSVLAGPAAPLEFDDNLARRNARVLAVAQALAGGNNTVVVATASIVGAVLAPDKGLATLPITFMIIGMWLGTLPVGVLARAVGRRAALQVGSGFGVLSGLTSATAVFHSSFGLFLVGTFFAGLYAAAHQSYRFAAADTASEAFRPKAISWVLAGGVAASVIGPQLVIFTKDIWAPNFFAASYIGQSVCAVIAAIVLVFVKIPDQYVAKKSAAGRPLSEIAATPRFIVAVACGVVSFALMNMIMTSAPLAMVTCGHSITEAALGIQWHVLAMYAPSFFTGSLILRFGVERVVAVGLVLIALTAVTDIAGITVAHFWGGLVLLGLGWNFAFIGATTMITHCHRPEERNKVQAFNDFLIFGSMAIASFASGKILDTLGWTAVNLVIFPFVAMAVLLLGWLIMKDRTRTA